jgi:antitoxin CptB
MTPLDAAGADRRRLLWRCRRGMKELDILLERYAHGLEPYASAAECEAFERLLDLPDPQLAAYLLGAGVPTDPDLARIVLRVAAAEQASQERGSRPRLAK